MYFYNIKLNINNVNQIFCTYSGWDTKIHGNAALCTKRLQGKSIHVIDNVEYSEKYKSSKIHLFYSSKYNIKKSMLIEIKMAWLFPGLDWFGYSLDYICLFPGIDCFGYSLD